MSILEQAEQLRQQAILILVQERETIEQKLTQLGYDGAPAEVRNRKPKTCGRCGQEGHTMRTCPSPEADSVPRDRVA
jgi:hypothetical protein